MKRRPKPARVPSGKPRGWAMRQVINGEVKKRLAINRDPSKEPMSEDEIAATMADYIE